MLVCCGLELLMQPLLSRRHSLPGPGADPLTLQLQQARRPGEGQLVTQPFASCDMNAPCSIDVCTVMMAQHGVKCRNRWFLKVYWRARSRTSSRVSYRRIAATDEVHEELDARQVGVAVQPLVRACDRTAS